jgi:hypothetical protein
MECWCCERYRPADEEEAEEEPMEVDEEGASFQFVVLEDVGVEWDEEVTEEKDAFDDWGRRGRRERLESAFGRTKSESSSSSKGRVKEAMEGAFLLGVRRLAAMGVLLLPLPLMLALMVAKEGSLMVEPALSVSALSFSSSSSSSMSSNPSPVPPPLFQSVLGGSLSVPPFPPASASSSDLAQSSSSDSAPKSSSTGSFVEEWEEVEEIRMGFRSWEGSWKESSASSSQDST